MKHDTNFRPVWSHLKTVVDRRLKQPVKSGIGFTWNKVGTDEITYAVEINERALETMARKAYTNSNKKSTDGPLRVVIRETRKLT